MENDGWTEWEGKKVYVKLKSDRVYSGIIKRVEIVNPIVWITLTDKFGSIVTFSAEEIRVIEEER